MQTCTGKPKPIYSNSHQGFATVVSAAMETSQVETTAYILIINILLKTILQSDL